ncbi:hypothetical protein PLESTB_001814100 [Pleodorina starrii]|uniref:Uncharacterized protein n=1 Tax=Pleodorina starrii TaxID=330485 RepID=A0A9W6C2F2_9CHLO|nr:hypothetical protein PLESTB_001814100 [Pleodorina starrii]
MDGTLKQPAADTPEKCAKTSENCRSLSNVLQEVAVIWDYLCLTDAKNLKATCKLARTQHIHWCQKFFIRVEYGKCNPARVLKDLDRLAALGYRPAAIEVVCNRFIAANQIIQPLAHTFGAHLTHLSFRLDRSVDSKHEKNIRLAPSAPPGAKAITAASNWAAPLAAALPALRSLGLEIRGLPDATSAEPLLRLLGPQLRGLSLNVLWSSWLPAWIDPRVVPSLESLKLDARRCVCEDEEEHWNAREERAAPSAARLATLTSLRSLELSTYDEAPGEGVLVPERELLALSALTGLTHLVLDVPQQVPLEDPTHDCRDDFTCFARNCWRLAPLLAGGLAAASLAELSLPSSYIAARDCAALAAATALTRLRCAGLATPPAERCGGGGGAGGGAAEMPVVPLPPNLRQLQVRQVPTLHLAACLAALPATPRLRLLWDSAADEDDSEDEDAYGGGGSGGGADLSPSLPLTLLGGHAARNGNAVPLHDGAVQPWVVAAAAAGARYLADAVRRWEWENRPPPPPPPKAAAAAAAAASRSRRQLRVTISSLQVYEERGDAAVRFARAQMLAFKLQDTGRGRAVVHRRRRRSDDDDDDDDDDYSDDVDDVEISCGGFDFDEFDGGESGDDVKKVRGLQRRGEYRRRRHPDEGGRAPTAVAGPHGGWLTALAAPLAAPLAQTVALSVPGLRLAAEELRLVVGMCPKLVRIENRGDTYQHELERLRREIRQAAGGGGGGSKKNKKMKNRDARGA